MIVQPDFADHWKTCLLVSLTDHSAVACVLRFWAHCQNRRQWEFKDMTPQIFAAICRWQGDPETFWSAMSQTFIEVSGKNLIAHEWREVNSSLIAAWERGKYGSLGGRPKEPVRKPATLEAGTLDKPEKSREEKIDKRREKDRSANGSHQQSKKNLSNGLVDSEWIARLKQDQTYQGIDVDRELGKMTNWCATNRKVPSRQRFINWLNRAERPMGEQVKEAAPKGRNVW